MTSPQQRNPRSTSQAALARFALACLGVAALLGGCGSGLSTADYTFACTTNAECLAGFSCIEGLCQSGLPDSVGDSTGDTQAGTDDAGSDSTTTGLDSDAADAGSDATEPGSDTGEPGSDAGAPGSDAAEPGSDAVAPGSDAVEPGSDAAAPGSDAVDPGSDAAAPGSDVEGPGSDTAAPGSDAEIAGSDATAPGSDATSPGTDATAPGSDAVDDDATAGSDASVGSDVTAPDCNTLDCEDGNPCTLDQCEPAEGCTHSPTSELLPCEWPNGCVTPAICVSGTCTSQGGLLWRASSASTGGRPSGPLPWNADGLGVLRAAPAGGVELLRAKNGVMAAPQALGTSAGVVDVGVLTPYPDEWLIATSGSGETSDLALTHWHTDGSSDWQQTIELAGEQRLLGMVLTTGWQSWVVASDQPTAQLMVIRLDSGGNVLGSTMLGGNAAGLPALVPSRTVLGVRALDVDGAVLVGRAVQNQPGGAQATVGWIARLDGNGQLLWEWFADAADGTSEVRDARPETDGIVWVGSGTSPGTTLQQARWGRLHLNGGEVYTESWSSAAHLSLHKLVWFGAGWIAAGTSLATTTGATSQLWWARLGEDGTLHGSRLVTQAGAVDEIVDLSWDSSVTTAVLATQASGGWSTQVQRSDLWGNATCSTWSACGNKGEGDCADYWPCTLEDCTNSLGCTSTATPVLCDDDNVCTDDSCTSLSGCVYQNNAATCSDGASCTEGDVCSGGSCAPGAPQLYAQTFTGSGDRVFYDADAVPDGSVVAVGSTGYGAAMAANLTHISANGALIDDISWNTPTSDFATAVAYNANNAQPVFAVGARVASYSDSTTWAAMIGRGTFASNTWNDLDGMSIAWDVAALGNGAVATGELAVFTARSIVVTRIPGSGEQGWTTTLGPCEPWDTSQGEMTASGGVHVTSDAVYVADAVLSLGLGDPQGYVARLAHDGSLVWSMLYGGSGADRLRSVTTTSDGTLYAYGDTTSLGNGSQDGWLVRINPATGQATGQWNFDTVLQGLSYMDLASRVVYDPASTASEGLFLVGTVLTGATNARQMSVRRVLPGGGLHWQRLYGGAGEEEGYGLAHTPNQTHMVVGRSNTNTGQTIAALALRMDDWGHPSCAEGACYGHSVDFCSDGIPCTADDCSASSGQCTSVAITPCSP